VGVFFPPCRKITESGGIGIHSAFECADLHLVVVAGVDTATSGALINSFQSCGAT
jgi:hypothetical protein